MVNDRLLQEIAVRRWSRRGPFYSCGLPWIVFCLLATEDAPENIEEKDELHKTQGKCTHRDKDIQAFKVLQKLILHWVRDASHVAAHPKYVHREERAVEGDKGKPEMNVTQRLIPSPAKHLGKPVIDPGEYCENTATENHVVDVCDNVVSIMNENVHRRGSHEDPGKAADHEHRNERQRI